MRRTILVVAGVALGIALTAGLVVRLRHRGLRPDGRTPRIHDTGGPPPRPECQVGPTTPGIDVSYYQNAIDWPRVQRAGIRFAFIRLADGVAQRDPRFATNWVEARRAGLARGAYLFFRPDQDVAAQADLMISAMSGRDSNDLPPVIDIEADGGLPPAIVAARARDWVDRVRRALGVEPIVYTGSDLWRQGGAEPLAGQPLWVAHYTQSCPTLPQPWTRWTFWQHTDRGAVPGIDGAVDLDLFAGTLGELHAKR